MTFEQNAALPRRFVTSVLPWLIGLGAAVVYLATMSQWATINSIGVVARESGWLWQPQLHQPLAFLLYSPFRLLPEHLVPIALNVFNVFLAALTVTLLARAVALLPHDRTSDQRNVVTDKDALPRNKTAWIPPLLASIVLGLQISFWESATAVAAEIIDVLVFTYVLRCLLEFRIDQRQSWLYRAAFVYALGMTNNWVLIGLAPVFLVIIVWIRGLAVLNARFILGLSLWGLLGLSFYLLIPILQSFSSQIPLGFRDSLSANLSSQKQMLLWTYAYLKENYRVVVIGATSLLPLFFIGLRWRASFGDTSPIGIFITKTVFHLAHAVFFIVCLLVVFSPPYSPRQQFTEAPFTGAILIHTVLAALVVGYCAGYFLVICTPALRSRGRMNSLLKLVGRVTWGSVLLVSILVPVALASRNLVPIQLTNGGLMDRFLSLSLAGLSEKPGAIVSDDPVRLLMTRAFLVHRGDAGEYLFYDTRAGEWNFYQIAQRREQGERWPDTFKMLTNSARIPPIGLLAFMSDLTKAGPTYYLEPSLGYYFEHFDLQPEGLAFAIKPYATNALFHSLPEPAQVGLIEQQWAEFDEQLLPVLRRCIPSDDAPPLRPKWLARLYARLHLKPERVRTAEIIGQQCSRMATFWAVELQKLDKWPEAATALRRAVALNPENIAARINLNFNLAHQAGKPAPTTLSTEVEQEFNRYRDWNQVMEVCGPFDEPRFTFEQGRTFYGNNLFRQALGSVRRVVQLDPTNFTASVWLADLYNLVRHPEMSLELVQHMRAEPVLYDLSPAKQLFLDRLEASALFRSGKTEEGLAVLEKALAKEEVGIPFRATAAELYMQQGQFAAALPLLQQVVEAYPSDPRMLANLGLAHLRLGQYEDARTFLTRALELDPKNSVIRLNRAISLLRAKDYEAAKADYVQLEEAYPNAYQVQFGLGEIAAAADDNAAAAAYFKECLRLTPPGSQDYTQVSNRLVEAEAKLK